VTVVVFCVVLCCVVLCCVVLCCVVHVLCMCCACVVHVLCCACAVLWNWLLQGQEGEGLQVLGERLAEEVVGWAAALHTPGSYNRLTQLSFVGHSLGVMIVRSACAHPKASEGACGCVRLGWVVGGGVWRWW
jgi:hypothetical protein